MAKALDTSIIQGILRGAVDEVTLSLLDDTEIETVVSAIRTNIKVDMTLEKAIERTLEIVESVLTEGTEDVTEVEIERTRRIVVGGRYRLSSSYEYSGIEPGVVEITNITRATSSMAVREEIRIWIQSYMGEEQDLEATRLNSMQWVEYHYIDAKHGEEVEFLPIEEFLDHTSIV